MTHPPLIPQLELIPVEPGCKMEVSWMFDHLNTDGDSLLSLNELFNIKNDHNEKCIKPFLDQCDTDG